MKRSGRIVGSPMIRSYSELIKLVSFRERFEYLRLNGKVAEETFGPERQINQEFYHSGIWLPLRDRIIARDNGRDLGLIGYDIPDGVTIIVHHLNPITIRDIIEQTDFLLNPEFLITTTLNTHNAIHYGDESLLIAPVQRIKNDTCPWKK